MMLDHAICRRRHFNTKPISRQNDNYTQLAHKNSTVGVSALPVYSRARKRRQQVSASCSSFRFHSTTNSVACSQTVNEICQPAERLQNESESELSTFPQIVKYRKSQPWLSSKHPGWTIGANETVVAIIMQIVGIRKKAFTAIRRV